MGPIISMFASVLIPSIMTERNFFLIRIVRTEINIVHFITKLCSIHNGFPIASRGGSMTIFRIYKSVTDAAELKCFVKKTSRYEKKVIGAKCFLFQRTEF